MFTSKPAASVLAVLLLVFAVSPAASAAASSQQEAYAGTHVSFDTGTNAIVDYAVDGQTVMESVKVESVSEAQSRAGIDVGMDIDSVTTLDGAPVSVDATTDTSARISTDSGAQVHAHDNHRGILVVRAGGERQYVMINVSSSSTVDQEDDQRVIVTTEDGTTGAFIVAGDGSVAINEEGNVTADLGSNSELVFRSYADGRDEDDTQEEELIADGKAAAEVYVMHHSENSGEAVADVVHYSEDTTVEVTEQGQGTVKLTAERAAHQGKIIITSVSDEIVESTDDLEVAVDGEAAAQASSHSELESAIDNGDSSTFLVRGQSNAEASTDVLVAVNHFSEREITMTSPQGTSETTNTDDDSSTPTQPGFGVGVAVLALSAATLLARRYA